MRFEKCKTKQIDDREVEDRGSSRKFQGLGLLLISKKVSNKF